MKQILSLPEQFGPVLRAARKASGLSQAALGQRIGLSQSRLSALEQDPRSLSLEQLLGLISALGLELQVQSRAFPGVPAGAPPEW